MSGTFKGILATSALLGLMAIAGHAQDAKPQDPTPSKRQKIEFIIEVMKMDDQYDIALEIAIPPIIGAIRAQNTNISDDQVEEITSMIRAMAPTFRSDMFKVMTNAWDTLFSEEEVNSYYNYAQTDVGAKVILKTKDFSDEVKRQIMTYAKTVFGPNLSNRIKSNEKTRNIRVP